MAIRTKTSGQREVERMRQKNKIVISDFSVCYYCKTTGLNEAEQFCPNCGFPQRGTDFEQKKFIRAQKFAKQRLEDMQMAVVKARNTLFLIGGLTIIPYLITSMQLGDGSIMVIGTMLALCYLGLALWSRKQPFSAILTGMILYVSMWVLYCIADPSNIYRGIFYRIMAISALY
ncbi:MAG: hypothetical protein ACHQRM_06005 [Bacteroidia bacterium]